MRFLEEIVCEREGCGKHLGWNAQPDYAASCSHYCDECAKLEEGEREKRYIEMRHREIQLDSERVNP